MKNKAFYEFFNDQLENMSPPFFFNSLVYIPVCL